MGDAIIKIGVHPWSEAEAARFPAQLNFDRGLTLDAVKLWSLPVSLMDVWPRTRPANTNPAAHWRGGLVTLAEADAELIIARGRRKKPLAER